MSDKLDPAVLELLASRICHDLISPVGAIHNGIEFMEDMGLEAGAEALELLSHSARVAAARLQVFRIAYGAGGRDPNIKPVDVQKVFGELLAADGKIVLEWQNMGAISPELPPGFCKILTGVLMMASESLPKGGVIRFSMPDETSALVVAEGPDAGLRAQVREALDGGLSSNDLDPRLVHPFVIGILAREYKLNLALDAATGGVVNYTLSFSA